MIHPDIDSLIVDGIGVVKISKPDACKDISTICTSNISAIPCFVIHCKGKKAGCRVPTEIYKTQFHDFSMIFRDQQCNFHDYLMHGLQLPLLATSSPLSINAE